jgi:serine/threonine-protein kinase RsbW
LGKQPTYRLDVPASTRELVKVRDFVSDHARGFGFDAQDVEEIRLAVDEAMTNVIKHAYSYDDSKTVYLTVGSTGNEFWVAIQDHGAAFNPATYEEPNVSERVKQGKKGGVGVYLIKRLMDKVEYSHKNSRNEIKMIKKL